MTLTPRGERMMATRKANEKKRIAEAAKNIPHSKFYFIEDDYNQAFRVWKDSNFGDQFSVIPYGDTTTTKEFVSRLCREYPNTFIYGDPPEDE